MLKNVYTVEQVNRFIKNMFATEPMLKKICVKGEISNCKYHSSGHIYFSIKDASGTIAAMMFLQKRKGLKFKMKDGDKVIITGNISVFERDGRYQLYADEIELDGEGNLYLQFEALKKELEEMGMFDPGYKKPIPKFVKTVGIVTAPTGAAIQDIRNIASRRNPYVQLILYPATVQGEGAKESIVAGIQALERAGVDVIIVGRGGGSIEDLWAFNEEMVARAIFDCKVPVISAVGHETDTTIADYVSDLRAPTPSAAAELAVFDYLSTKNKIVEHKLRLNRSMSRHIYMARQHLEHEKTKLKFLSPMNRLKENRRRLLELEEKITDRASKTLTSKKHRLMLLANTLEGLSPVKKISSGYAYVETNGKSIRTIENVQVSDEVLIHVTDGKMKAVVTEVSKNE